MKRIITLLLASASMAAVAQTKVLDHAIITTKTTIISPEGEDNNGGPAPVQSGDGGEVRVMRFGGDGETKSVTTIKGTMVKTYVETDMSRTTTLRDNDKKVTTTLMEMMGKKTGFYATDEDQAQMAKTMDSLMKSRAQNGGGNNPFTSNGVASSNIAYVDETKKVAGLTCKKAIVIAVRRNSSKDSTIVWYCPDFKLQGIVSTGGTSGFGPFSRATSLNGLDSIAGFPMQYEMKMPRGRKMIVEVTKINIDKEVSDKEFEIPKDFEIKPMKDMQNNMGRGGFQTRIIGG